MQKAAYFAQVPCVTLRDETEWVELVEHGVNTLGGHEPERICKAFDEIVERSISLNPDLYKAGKASEETVWILRRFSNDEFHGKSTE
jgi:UDP-GlcNAc3NAcA epimerase